MAGKNIPQLAGDEAGQKPGRGLMSVAKVPIMDQAINGDDNDLYWYMIMQPPMTKQGVV